MRTPQTQNELEQHLKDQIQFLKASCASFDNGFQGEAKRMAIAMRIMLHDSGGNTSLLTTLGLKGGFPFYRVQEPEVPVPGYTVVHRVRYGAGLTFTPSGFKFVADLREPKFTASFDDWWSEILIERHADGISLTRQQIVKAVADMDGGAHVDPKINSEYATILRNEAFHGRLSINGNPAEIENDSIKPILRQVAHELLYTLEQHTPSYFK